MKCSTSQKVF